MRAVLLARLAGDRAGVWLPACQQFLTSGLHESKQERGGNSALSSVGG